MIVDNIDQESGCRTFTISYGYQDVATSSSGTGTYRNDPVFKHKVYIEPSIEPHRVPNHYPAAPVKLEFKSQAPVFIHGNIKQPFRDGFYRGNRN